MKRLFALLLLAVVVLGVYYPSLFGHLCSVDDHKMVNTLINQHSIDLYHLFFRHGSYYYRPLLWVTFYLDRLLFFCQPEIMHFENILIHTCNTLLLFIIVFFIFRSFEDKRQCNSYLPLLIALFFGIHPLTSEAVNWISARSDLLVGFFCLLSFGFFLLPGERSKWWTDSISALFFLLGLFCKVVAISILAAISFSLLWQGLPTYRKSWLKRAYRMIPFSIATITYLWMRTGFYFAHDSGMTSAIKGAHDAVKITYFSKLGSLIKALGFYAKKIIWPFPLNFAIVEINRPLCFIIGIMVLVIVVWFLWRRRGMASFFLLWSVFFITPALLVAINKMAWTPLAERYLYIPLMGFSIAIGLILSRYARQGGVACFALVLFALGGVTTSRNIVWQNNLTLFADVVKKSPDFPLGHNEYATALLYDGQKEEAKKEFRLAAKLSGKGAAHTLASTNLAGLEKTDSSGEVLKDILNKDISPKLKKRFLKKLARDMNRRLLEWKNPVARKKLLFQTIKVQEELCLYDRNPFYRYRLAQLYLADGEKERAIPLFKKACERSNDFYTPAACKLYKKLSGELAKNE